MHLRLGWGEGDGESTWGRGYFCLENELSELRLWYTLYWLYNPQSIYFGTNSIHAYISKALSTGDAESNALRSQVLPMNILFSGIRLKPFKLIYFEKVAQIYRLAIQNVCTTASVHSL